MACTNLAHGFAATSPQDKEALRQLRWPNLAIVSAYNDMLSAHQPFERFPALIRLAARTAGAIAQVAGGVPAMCDGVTRGQPGMELSLFSRDVIAMSTAIALRSFVGNTEGALQDFATMLSIPRAPTQLVSVAKSRLKTLFGIEYP